MRTAAPEFSFTNLRQLAKDLEGAVLSPADICARYILLHLHKRHPAQWLSGPRHSPALAIGQGLLTELKKMEISLTDKQRDRLKSVDCITELFRRFFFRGVVLDSHEGMVGWIEQRYPLKLRPDIPSPDEMLEIQCEGARYVTLILNENAQFQPYGRHADACAFLLHDFEHAHKFFGDPESHRGQVRFFRAMAQTLAAFAPWAEDLRFKHDLDYLKSDMNSHPVHLIKYLKAVVLSAEMRKSGRRHPDLEGFWRDLFNAWNLDSETLQAALKINEPTRESASDLVAVASYFML